MHFASRCGALLLAGTLIVSPLASQNAPRVQHVSVLGSGQAIEVEIRTSAAIVPQSQAITGPDRIVIDFPGALPAPELRNLSSVNRGALKAIRTGLFSSKPPITRIVLDLSTAQPYTVFPGRNSVLLKVGTVSGPRLTEAALISTSGQSTSAQSSSIRPASAQSTSAILPLADQAAPEPLKPAMEVSYEYGLLRLHVQHATLAKVLFEIQQQTGAEIAIPAGAESEEIAAELGPAPVRDVLVELLNGNGKLACNWITQHVARVLGERVEDAPIYWSNCPYVQFQNR